jgi:hypothetical protein
VVVLDAGSRHRLAAAQVTLAGGAADTDVRALRLDR